MSALASVYLAERDLSPRKLQLRTKAKYRFVEFLRPNCYWPHPYSIEQAFGVFAWMVETGQSHKRRGQWGEHTIECVLSKKPTCVSIRTIEPIESITDLRERFHYAIFDQYSPASEAWRSASDVDAYASKILTFPHYQYNQAPECQAHLKGGLEELLGASGRLAVPLNKFHEEAREIKGVALTYSTFIHGWEFRLMYGYDGSRWSHKLAQQGNGETFTDTYLRARSSLAKLVA